MKTYSQDYPTQITFRKRAMDYYIHNIFVGIVVCLFLLNLFIR